MKPSHLIFDNPNLLKDYFFDNEEKSIKALPNFNRINIIIGANNSGKSRFIRSLISLDKLKVADINIINLYNNCVDECNRKGYGDSLKKINYNDIEETINNNNILPRYQGTVPVRNRISELNDKIILEYKDLKRIYIPTLRSAHSLYIYDDDKFRRIETDIYLDTLNKYYSIKNKNVEIFSGMTLYEEILDSRNSEKEIRNKFESFEKFLSKNFFEGKQIDIVAKFNKSENKQGKNESELILIHVEGENKTRSLYELGDGIQALIILMYKIFMAVAESFIFIDEPELNLHPGMQRLFLEQISSNPGLIDKKLTYIITTHSNHFLDLTIEQSNVSIYSFSPKAVEKGKNKQFVIKNVNRGDNSILKHLGVNNSSVFMANCSLWVEGVSDRNYIKAFLKSYTKYLSDAKSSEYKSLKEDIDYAFFEYAGSNIEHYIFEKEISDDEENQIIKEIDALALSNKIFLLADSDNAIEGDAKWERLKKLEAIKVNNFTAKIIREVRESENLLTNDVWERVLINFCNKNLLKNHKEEIKEKISLALNKVDSSNYKTDYIGKFLNELNKRISQIDEINVLNQIFEKKGSVPGTLIPKKELSQYVLEADIEWEVFAKSKEIETLTKEVYQFIIDSMN